jgi:hypothetical protein
MEAVFSDPKKVKALFSEALVQAEATGEMTEEEMVSLVKEAERGPTKGQGPVDEGMNNRNNKGNLRGEGGSGEKRSREPIGSSKRGEVRGEEERASTERGGRGSMKEWEKMDKGEASQEGVQESGEEEEDWTQAEEGVGGDVEAHADDTSQTVQTSSTEERKRERSELQELKAYCEEQFASFASMIQPLASRIEGLERMLAAKVPLGQGMMSPTRGTHGRSESMEGVVIGRGKAREREKRGTHIPKDKVQAFARENLKYPAMRVTREAKMRQLQELLGLEPKSIVTKASEWNGEGLYTLLVIAHNEE